MAPTLLALFWPRPLMRMGLALQTNHLPQTFQASRQSQHLPVVSPMLKCTNVFLIFKLCSMQECFSPVSNVHSFLFLMCLHDNVQKSIVLDSEQLF